MVADISAVCYIHYLSIFLHTNRWEDISRSLFVNSPVPLFKSIGGQTIIFGLYLNMFSSYKIYMYLRFLYNSGSILGWVFFQYHEYKASNSIQVICFLTRWLAQFRQTLKHNFIHLQHGSFVNVQRTDINGGLRYILYKMQYNT